jgi:hypothetical protein
VTRQRWSTAGGCLMLPASGESIYIYTRHGLENFLSLARIRNDVVRLPNFPAERHRRPRPPPPLRPPRRRPGVPGPLPSSVRAPPSSAVAPPPLLPWTAVALSSAVAPPPGRPSATAPLPYHDGVFLPTGRFPNCWPGPAGDCSAAAASADSAAHASADSAAPARHRQLISSPLGTHGGRG